MRDPGERGDGEWVRIGAVHRVARAESQRLRPSAARLTARSHQSPASASDLENRGSTPDRGSLWLEVLRLFVVRLEGRIVVVLVVGGHAGELRDDDVVDVLAFLR